MGPDSQNRKQFASPGLCLVLLLYALVPLIYLDSPNERNRLKEPVAWSAGLAAAAYLCLRRRPRHTADVAPDEPGSFGWAGLLLIWSTLISTGLSSFRWAAPATLVPFGCGLLGSLALSRGLDTAPRRRTALNLVGMGYVLAALTYIAFGPLGLEGAQNPGWARPFGNPNLAAGALLGPTLCALVIVLGHLKRRQRSIPIVTAFLLVAVGGAVLMLSGSAGAWVGFGCALLPATLSLWGCSWSRVVRTSSIVLLLIAILAIACQVFAPAFLTSLLGTALEERLMIWRGTVALWLETPLSALVGQGPGAFLPAFPAAAGPAVHAGPQPSDVTELAHNLYLHTAAEVGAIGLFLLLGLIFSAGRSTREALRRAQSPAERDQVVGITCGALATLVHASVSVAPHYPSTATNLWLALALLTAASRPLPHPDRGPLMPPPQAHLAWRLRLAVVVLLAVAWFLLVPPRIRTELEAHRGGVAWMRRQDPQSALPHYDAMLDTLAFDDRVTLLFRIDRARVLANALGPEPALAAMEAVQKRAPHFGSTAYERGLYALQAGDALRAAQALELMSRINPYQWRTYLLWLEARLERIASGATIRMGHQLEQAVAQRQSDFGLLAVHGLWRMQTGNHAKAIPILRRALQIKKAAALRRLSDPEFDHLRQRIRETLKATGESG